MHRTTHFVASSGLEISTARLKGRWEDPDKVWRSYESCFVKEDNSEKKKR